MSGPTYDYDKGRRVELLHCSDPHTRLEPGELGTVQFTDSVGTLHVKWDGGASLGLIPGEDAYRFVAPPGTLGRRFR